MARKNYLGAITPFGVIVELELRLYNATATCVACDGSRSEHKLPKLIALGLTLKEESRADHPERR